MRYSEIVPKRLYHGTSLLNLVSILHTGGIRTSAATQTDEEVIGVPTTPDEKIARWFAVNSTKAWFETMHFEIADPSTIETMLYDEHTIHGAVIFLDGAALARRYRVVALTVANQEGLDEQELRIVTDRPLPLAYMTGFKVQPHEVEFFANLIRHNPKAGWSETPEQIITVLHHPKRLA